MTVQELIEKLSSLAPESHVLIQYMNGDAFGSAWQDTEIFDEDDIIVKDDTVILDISDK